MPDIISPLLGKKLRITTSEQKAIVNITHKFFDKNAEVYLFG